MSPEGMTGRNRLSVYTKFSVPYWRARLKRAAYVVRRMRRQGRNERYDMITQVWGEVIRFQGELPARGSLLEVTSREDEPMITRINPGRDRWVQERGGLSRFITRVVQQERSEDPLSKYLDVGGSSYFKRVAGRFLYVAVNSSILAVPTYFYEVVKSNMRGQCACGKHSVDWGLCDKYWERVGLRLFEDCFDEGLYAISSGDTPGAFGRLLASARYYLTRNDQGQQFARSAVRKSIVKFIPGAYIARGVGGVLSSLVYISLGRKWGIRDLERMMDSVAVERMSWAEFDEILFALRLFLNSPRWGGRVASLETMREESQQVCRLFERMTNAVVRSGSMMTYIWGDDQNVDHSIVSFRRFTFSEFLAEQHTLYTRDSGSAYSKRSGVHIPGIRPGR